jgi:hypothetical protein
MMLVNHVQGALEIINPCSSLSQLQRVRRVREILASIRTVLGQGVGLPLLPSPWTLVGTHPHVRPVEAGRKL